MSLFFAIKIEILLKTPPLNMEVNSDAATLITSPILAEIKQESPGVLHKKKLPCSPGLVLR